MPARTKKKVTGAKQAEDFSDSLRRFRELLKKYEKRCVVDTDTDEEYHLNFKPDDPEAKPKFFAGTGLNKTTISFYLAPIHDFATLRASLSPQLKKHLSGKCCFRFKAGESISFAEVAALTERGFELCRPLRGETP